MDSIRIFGENDCVDDNDNYLEECAIIPCDVDQFYYLQTLMIVNSTITCIPREIGNLTKLKELDLENNSILEIPLELYTITTLKYINITRNLIFSISRNISNLINLERLELPSQYIRLPIEIKSLKLHGYFRYIYKNYY